MKLRLRNIAWLLPFLLTACFHKEHRQQPQSLAPTAQPEISITPEPPPDLLPSASTDPNQPVNTSTGTKPKPPAQHKKPVVKTTKPVDSSPVATNPESHAVSVIGQLSSGDPSGQRRETVDLITSTERRLDSIGRTLNSQEQTTSVQIRSFLKQAREALVNGDVDGAHTLAAKAKVLFSELGQ